MAGISIWLWIVSGCGKPPVLIKRYIFDYPAPAATGRPALNAGLKVEQLAVAQAYNTTAMVYQAEPFKSDAYHYHRWRVNPGFLVTDYLVRDLRNSGLFKAVWGATSSDDCRFRLEGGVAECLEIDRPEGWQAALGLHLTLLDLDHQEITRRVMFQKNYRALEPLVEKTPEGLAQAMSQAMQRLSIQIINDLYQAIHQRLGAPSAS
ncbi:MAG: ABC-type transport auxiliary lipoprotein family protein [Desulfobacca sp.]|nr:ABC-type transport auxiliary lipoprotein family protein [Desulfobacca sp.]